MVKLTYIAEQIESGLNAVLGNNSPYNFRIWADAGEFNEALRSGNVVEGTILANLRSVSSANEGNILVMGANGLMLDFAVPVKRPKTSAGQTAEELKKVDDGQYAFVEYIRGIIDGYFQVSRVFTASDTGAGSTYTISMDAGVAQTGTVDILPVLDECIPISVFINLTFLEGGVNARNVVLTIDGVRVPFATVTFGRSNRLSPDVYSDGNAVVKNLATATALSIDFAFPANADNNTKQAFLSLLEGKPNVAHFVEVSVGSQFDGSYMMMFDNLQMNAQGVMFAGITGTLIEVANRADAFDVPDYMEIGRFVFADSSETSFSFGLNPRPTRPLLSFIAGNIYEISTGMQVTLTPDDFVYDETSDKYYVYAASLGTLNVYTLTVNVGGYEVVKEAS